MRQAMLADVQRALTETQHCYPFAEAYRFGSLIRSERFQENSESTLRLVG